MSFNNLLKDIDIDVNLHKQYTLEKFKEGHTGRNFVVEAPKFEFTKPVFKKSIDLPKASTNSFANEYLTKRKIDPDKFYYADKFMEWTNTQKQTFDTITRDESRIVIPMYDENKNLIGFQGRALGKSFTKYITVMLDEEAPKVYGIEKIDKTIAVYITEGPFDSTFICNSITQHSFATRLPCAELTLILVIGALSILFGSMITNHAIEKSSIESVEQSIMATP
jgi:hypothetical protein